MSAPLAAAAHLTLATPLPAVSTVRTCPLVPRASLPTVLSALPTSKSPAASIRELSTTPVVGWTWSSRATAVARAAPPPSGLVGPHVGLFFYSYM